MRFGAVTMSMRSPRVPDGIAVDAVLTDMPQKFSGNATVLKVDNAWLSGDGKAPDYARIDSGNEDDICRIILTSGSTGDAKGIAFSHKMLAARIANYAS